MKIESIRIQNFRSLADIAVTLDEYTCLVGANGAGKSSVLCALNIFFRDTENSATDVVNLSEEDFHQRNTAEPVCITVTFGNLSAEAQEDFKDYYRNGKLIVGAVARYDTSLGKAEVKQFGHRLGLDDFRGFFEANANGAKVADLKPIYTDLRRAHPELPAPGSKDAMIDALHEYEAGRPDQCVPIPSEDQFYGFSRGANRLGKYIQWVYIPAVKDVTSEQTEGKNTALGKLLARTVRLKLKFDDVIRELQKQTEAEYQKILDDNQGALKDLERSLTDKMAIWAHPGASLKLTWQKDSRSAVQIPPPNAKTIAGEGAFEGDLARLGHGFQRSYLLAVLQVLATVGDEGAPILILGCEEPELYQHPPQVRHLASVFEQLSADNAQIIVSTHHPSFVSGKGFEAVRMVRFDAAQSRSVLRHLTFDEFAADFARARGEQPRKAAGVVATLHQALQPGLNELFFSKNLVLVEGLEDLAYISTWMVLSGRWNDFRKLGLHIVATGGKSRMISPLVIAKGFNIPSFIVFDADGNDLDKNGNRKGAHKKDNETLLALLGATTPDPFPANTVWADKYAVWPTTFADVVRAEIPADDLQRYEAEARVLCGHAPDMEKNGIFIGEVLRLAYEEGVRPPSLERLCNLIFAAAVG